MLAFDRSGALLSYDDAVAHIQHGMPLLMQCLWDGLSQPQPRIINLRNMDVAGGFITAYLSPSQSYPDSLERARAGVPDDLWNRLKVVFYDLEELNAPWVPYNRVLADLDKLAAMGKPKAIYTNYDTWVNIYHNPPWPENCYLLNASYDGTMTPYLPLSFGGLREGDPRIIGRQYASGPNEDLDIFLDSFIVPTPPPPVTPVPTKEEQILALVSFGHLIRVENQGLLSNRDREAINYALAQLPRNIE